MTLSAFGMVLALVVLVAGVASFDRRADGRTRWLGILGSVVVGIAIGWFSWLAGTSA